MKKGISIALVVLMLLSLIACSDGGGGSSSGASPSQGSTAAQGGGGGSAAEPASGEKKVVTVFSKKREWDWEAIEKAYEAARPDVDLVVDLTDANTYYDVLKGYLASGDLPDVIQTVSGATINLWKEHLIPLNDLQVLKAMDPDIVAEYLIGGDYYGVPLFMELHGVIYNMKYLEQVGFTEPPKTLNEFADLSQKLQSQGLPTGISPWSTAAAIVGHMLAPVFGSHDDPVGYMKQIQNGEIDLTQDAGWNALYDYLDATLEYGNADALVTDNTTERNALYAEEYAWYAHDGSWLTPAILNTNPDLENRIRLGAYPFTNDAAANKIGRSTQSLSIMNTAHAQDAKDFVDWLLGSDEGCDILVKVCNTVLLRKDYEMQAGDIGVLSAQGVEYVQAGNSYGNFRHIPDEITAGISAEIHKYLGRAASREESLKAIQALFESTK